MNPSFDFSSARTLPRDGTAGALAGRIWCPELDEPSIVAIRTDGVFDITAVAPTIAKDRDAAGRGFTHHDGDLVTIAAPELGALVNCMQSSAACPSGPANAFAHMCGGCVAASSPSHRQDGLSRRRARGN